MTLFASPTSPYARLVRVAFLVKDWASALEVVPTDPWADDPQLLQANPIGRVPTLLLDDGTALSESLLIVQWLELQRPRPSLFGTDPQAVLARAGVAFGAIDAAAALIIGRRIAGAGFDTAPVGLRRRRALAEAVARLDTVLSPAAPPTLDVLCAVVLHDYLAFRFPRAAWLPGCPRLSGLADRLDADPRVRATLPSSP